MTSELNSNGTVLLDTVGELLIGLVLKRFDANELSLDAARNAVIEIVDAYETDRFDVEGLLAIELDDDVFNHCRCLAKSAHGYVEDEKYLDSEIALFEV